VENRRGDLRFSTICMLWNPSISRLGSRETRDLVRHIAEAPRGLAHLAGRRAAAAAVRRRPGPGSGSSTALTPPVATAGNPPPPRAPANAEGNPKARAPSPAVVRPGTHVRDAPPGRTGLRDLDRGSGRRRNGSRDGVRDAPALPPAGNPSGLARTGPEGDLRTGRDALAAPSTAVVELPTRRRPSAIGATSGFPQRGPTPFCDTVARSGFVTFCRSIIGDRGMVAVVAAQRGVAHRRQLIAMGIGRGSLAAPSPPPPPPPPPAGRTTRPAPPPARPDR
jgi:hypothetical protein